MAPNYFLSVFRVLRSSQDLAVLFDVQDFDKQIRSSAYTCNDDVPSSSWAGISMRIAQMMDVRPGLVVGKSVGFQRVHGSECDQSI